MSQCGDYEDIFFYGINVFYGIVIAVYFLPLKKNHPVLRVGIEARHRCCSVPCLVDFIANDFAPSGIWVWLRA